MKVQWSRTAARDLADACDYVAADNEEAADRLFKLIRASANRLANFPRAGREGRVKNTRELVIPGAPYIVVYRLTKESTAKIISVLRGKRRWPTSF